MDVKEEADRKNARVIDKLEIALPLELDDTQRIDLVRAFVKELAGGRDVPFFAAFHDKPATKDESNPHAHLVIRDRDPRTGKGRIIGMSEKGSTERAREVWQGVCNKALAAAGSTARIDRRSLKAQGIDRAPQGHQGPQAREIAAKGKQSDKLNRIQSAPGYDPALSTPERRQRTYTATRQEREARQRLQAAAKAAEALRQQEEVKMALRAADARRRAAMAQREADARELERLVLKGRALILQDRSRIMLAEQYRLALLGAEWAALELQPSADDLDTASRWIARGNGKRLDENPWLPPKSHWVAEFKEALIKAWRWIASLIERKDPAADQAAARWASFHEEGRAVMAEWRELVDQDVQSALKAGQRYPEPDISQTSPKPLGPSNGLG